METVMRFIDVSIFSVKGNDDRIHFLCISKDEAINIMKIPDLIGKSGTL